MARPKKTDLVVDNAVTAQDTEVKDTTVSKVQPKVRKEIDRNRMVPCRNITSGILVYTSTKSGVSYLWQSFGDTEYVDVGELITMKSSQPRIINEPWLMIDDDEVAEYMGLTQLYDKFYEIEDVASFLTTKDLRDIDTYLKSAPKGARELIADKSREMVENETLNDIRVIRFLEKELDIDLQLVID